jgi:hypothetical protein
MEPSRGKSICVPFESEDHYAACVAEPECLPQHLGALHREPPKLFPERFAGASGATTRAGLYSRSSGRAASSSRPRGSSFRYGPRSCCLTWSHVPTRWRRPSTCATGACPSTRSATCSDVTRCSGIEPKSLWDGPPSSAAPSSSPRGCPRTCSPTRSIPGRSRVCPRGPRAFTCLPP